ncbi:Branched-chain amino acid transport protein (AzlD) [Lentzea xinjiangensis]|uniref:Branched-chain amino acid transport protein (AzlD) n=1 Tax=Lentzea xinjiangensis TaxID=402600 RepID=A0A1H9U3Q5_9PSEU|nr:AzlD domain-containing protein [Lentzea xinjiangensis]SES03794.1 Branched-chain amino acid transport protein (AzlD) [Lentzea xinjiangensis]
MPVTAILILAVGTFATRFVGPLLRDRVTLPEKARELMSASATVLLLALVVISALTNGKQFGGWALAIGVLVGGLAAWRKLPFVAVIVLAALTTAGLRMAGVA